MANLSGVWTKLTDLEIASGQGSWVTTTSGEKYLDFVAGIAVNSTGHSHPVLVEAIAKQAARGLHLQVNMFSHDLLQPLADKLAEVTPAGIDTFFFTNSGAEVTEAAVKLAKQATGRPHTIVFHGSFHGRTHMAMAMTTSKTIYRAGYAPLPAGVFVAPFPDVHADDIEAEVVRALDGFDLVLKTMTDPSETACVIVEPVLGEGGYRPAPAGFLEGIAARCKEHGILFVADEVQSGAGRTGKMWAIEHYDVEPDIICMAKGIASGFPFAALGTRKELDDKWTPGSHGGTYGGNPMGCAASLATFDVLTADGFLAGVQARGDQLASGLRRLQAERGGIVNVRQLGLMVAVDFIDAATASAVVKHTFDEGNVILMTTGHAGVAIRFMPPLTVTEDEIDLVLAALDKALVSV